MKSIYVGNLPYETTRDDLWALFESYGDVGSAKIVVNRETGRSRGFGFVEMPRGPEADRAIAALHGTRLDGRIIIVTEARPREGEPVASRSAQQFASSNL